MNRVNAPSQASFDANASSHGAVTFFDKSQIVYNSPSTNSLKSNRRGRGGRVQGGLWRCARDRRWRQSAACGESARPRARCCGSGAAGIGHLALRVLTAASGAANLLAMGSPRTDACAQARARTRARAHTHTRMHPRNPPPPHPRLHHDTHRTNTARTRTTGGITRAHTYIITLRELWGRWARGAATRVRISARSPVPPAHHSCLTVNPKP
jgi:hypothetical protein